MNETSFLLSTEQNRLQCLYVWNCRDEYLTNNIRNILVGLTIVRLTAAIFTVVLNTLVIVAVIKGRQLRSNCNTLLACLAGNDLMVGALLQPMFAAADMKRVGNMGPYCDFDKTTLVITMFTGLVSLHLLTLISIERYVAIKHALRYAVIATPRRLKKAVVFCWVIALIEIIPYGLMALIPATLKYTKQVQYIDKILTAFLLVNICAIVYSNAYILSEARRQNKRLQSEQVPQEEARRLKKETKAARTLTVVLVALFVCYLPILAIKVLWHALTKLVELRVLYVMLWWCVFFSLLNSVVNPLIYCWRQKKFRDAFLKLLHLRQARVNIA